MSDIDGQSTEVTEVVESDYATQVVEVTAKVDERTVALSDSWQRFVAENGVDASVEKTGLAFAELVDNAIEIDQMIPRDTHALISDLVRAMDAIANTKSDASRAGIDDRPLSRSDRQNLNLFLGKLIGCAEAEGQAHLDWEQLPEEVRVDAVMVRTFAVETMSDALADVLAEQPSVDEIPTVELLSGLIEDCLNIQADPGTLTTERFAAGQKAILYLAVRDAAMSSYGRATTSDANTRLFGFAERVGSCIPNAGLVEKLGLSPRYFSRASSDKTSLVFTPSQRSERIPSLEDGPGVFQRADIMMGKLVLGPDGDNLDMLNAIAAARATQY